jgi:hypothetical protein
LAIFFALSAVDLAAFFTLRVTLLYVDFLAISFPLYRLDFLADLFLADFLANFCLVFLLAFVPVKLLPGGSFVIG